MSLVGTFETCRRTLKTFAYWGRPGSHWCTVEMTGMTQPGPTGMSAFAPLLGDKRTSILPHLTASVCSAFPFTPRA